MSQPGSVTRARLARPRGFRSPAPCHRGANSSQPDVWLSDTPVGSDCPPIHAPASRRVSTAGGWATKLRWVGRRWSLELASARFSVETPTDCATQWQHFSFAQVRERSVPLPGFRSTEPVERAGANWTERSPLDRTQEVGGSNPPSSTPNLLKTGSCEQRRSKSGQNLQTITDHHATRRPPEIVYLGRFDSPRCA
jgi:hypothetical protein